MVQQFNSCEYNSKREEECIELIYPKLSKISIDNGIMEKADNVYVIPADLGWSDLGTWTSVYDNAEKNELNNAINSKNILSYNSTGNIVLVKNKNKAARATLLLCFVDKGKSWIAIFRRKMKRRVLKLCSER